MAETTGPAVEMAGQVAEITGPADAMDAIEEEINT
jgi:hypothetical protein